MLERIDHVGIACRSIDATVERYVELFGLTVVSVERNESQGVREAMLVTETPGSYVQLIEPLADDTTVGRFLARRGEGIHHIGYVVADLPAALAEIGGKGVRLLDSKPRHGALGASIAFLHPADLGGVLTELVQSIATPGALPLPCGLSFGAFRCLTGDAGNMAFLTGTRDGRGACDLYTFF